MQNSIINCVNYSPYSILKEFKIEIEDRKKNISKLFLEKEILADTLLSIDSVATILNKDRNNYSYLIKKIQKEIEQCDNKIYELPRERDILLKSFCAAKDALNIMKCISKAVTEKDDKCISIKSIKQKILEKRKKAISLSKEEDLFLGRLIRDENNLNAKDLLLEAYLYKVGLIARKLKHKSIDVEDLEQEGVIGLIDAVKKFDYRKNIRFPSYADFRIRGEMLSLIREKASIIKTPREINNLINPITKTNEKIKLEKGRDATIAELCGKTGLSEEEVMKGLKYIRTYPKVFLAEEINDDGDTLLDFQKSCVLYPDNSIVFEELLIEASCKLEEIEKFLFEKGGNEWLETFTRRYGMDNGFDLRTLKTVGEYLGKAESTISGRIKKIFEFLNNNLGINKKGFELLIEQRKYIPEILG